MQKNILKSSFVAAASISMLVACGPATNAPTTPSASPSATPVASATPAASATPEASATPVASATPEASATPVASATPSTAPSATVAPTGAPLPSATSDISIIEKTTFNGKIYDDTAAPVEGVTVKVKSLNSSVPYEAETVTAGGTYAFNNAPSGVQVEIIASKSGFTTRRRVEVLKSNKQGDPNANKYDFGTDDATKADASATALSDKPEVIMVTPARNSSGIDPKTSFVIKFSEPMDKKTVEDGFMVRAYTTKQLTVDSRTTLTGSNAIGTITGTGIYDKSAFSAPSWNSDNSEVTFSFQEERALPSDKDSSKTVDYQLTFSRNVNNVATNVDLKDVSGTVRSTNYFKLTDGSHELTTRFAIKTDEVKPTISSVIANTDENKGVFGDALKVRYSERMQHLVGKTIAGGMNGTKTMAPASVPISGGGSITGLQAAENYKILATRNNGADTIYNNVKWSDLGGVAVFDTNDATHRTVYLVPPKYEGADKANFVAVGSSITTATAFANTMVIDVTAATTTPLLKLVKSDDFSEIALTAANLTAQAAGNDANVAAEIETKLNAQVKAAATAVLDQGAAIKHFTVTQSGGKLTFTFNPVYQAGVSTRYLGWLAADFGGLEAAGFEQQLKLTTIATGIFAKNTFADLYEVGDNIKVTVEQTVVDPAGNTVDTNGDNASANAS